MKFSGYSTNKVPLIGINVCNVIFIEIVTTYPVTKEFIEKLKFCKVPFLN